MSPGRNAATATSTSPPARSMRARSGQSAISARSARVVLRLARLSSTRPRLTKVITAADASK